MNLILCLLNRTFERERERERESFWRKYVIQNQKKKRKEKNAPS